MCPGFFYCGAAFGRCYDPGKTAKTGVFNRGRRILARIHWDDALSPNLLANQMKLKIYAALAALAALGALAAIVWIDTSDYRTALIDVGENVSMAAIEVQAKGLNNDMARTHACRGLIKEKPEGRACVVLAMEQIETSNGALLVMSSAASWLKYHPSDEDFRAMAVDAINIARSKLAADLPTLNRMAKIAEAHDRSKVLKLLNGQKSFSSRFAYLAGEFDRIEYEVMLPDVAQKQREWRLKTVTGGRL